MNHWNSVVMGGWKEDENGARNGKMAKLCQLNCD